jgi:hypothetical protein
MKWFEDNGWWEDAIGVAEGEAPPRRASVARDLRFLGAPELHVFLVPVYLPPDPLD